ncbi:hypothetical protein IWQ62_000235 [Dispira parvispora]|uniref:Hcy-binding domain-containing protein n=1 Tax=Dispira parvispora TaxID=1520584 RepID=A0A9W8AUW5_9FUNG|nr:hypothetical protein IWQ62_000235 [Dispira parvispora]
MSPPTCNDHAALVILDGSMGSYLETHYQQDLSTKLWSTKLLHSNPHLIRQVHLDYLRAGADIISTGTYQIAEHNLDDLEGHYTMRELFHQAFRLAVESCQRLEQELQKGHSNTMANPNSEQVTQNRRQPPRVALSLGSFGAVVGGGAEYTGEFGCADDQIYQFHRNRLQVALDVLAEEPQYSTYVRWVAFETIPSYRELEILTQVLHDLGQISPWRTILQRLKVWVSLVCRDSVQIRHGESLAKCVELLHQCPDVAVVGVNCTYPGDDGGSIRKILEVFRKATDKPLVCYPNVQLWDEELNQWSPSSLVSPASFAQQAQSWARSGATILGGCCCTTPAHIHQLYRAREAFEG